MAFTQKTFKNFSVHTYTAPEIGYQVNTHIVETKNNIIVIDTQFLIKSAEEIFQFTKKLGKPIERVIITHAHPDHWFGTSIFSDADIYALESVKKAMGADAVAAFERNKPRSGNLIADKAVLPNKILEPKFSVDGITVKVSEVKDTEAATIALIEIEEEKILFASDIAYSKIHLYIAENHIDEWKNRLKLLERNNYSYVFPGHGISHSPQVLIDTEKYLDTAERALKTCKTFDEFEKALLKAYPDYEGKSLLKANEMFLKF